VDHTADWWLGDLTHPWFLELERAIRDEWGAEPMRVREGGVCSLLSLSLSPSLTSVFAVDTMRTLPRKSLRLPSASPPYGPKLGAVFLRCLGFAAIAD
jgi:hypothetical protein